MSNKYTQHTVSQCNKKLVALLDKLNNLDTTRPDLRFQVDDAKVLAQELCREEHFLNIPR